MGRLAALLILASQVALVWVALKPNGTTAIWFSFVGHPLLAIGCALGLWALARRLRGERNSANPAPRSPALPPSARGVES
jgi:hypothetical protein